MLPRARPFFPVALLKFRSNLSQLYILRPLHFSYATFSNIFLITGPRSGSTIASHFLSICRSLRYPIGGEPGRSPISQRVRRPLFTLILLLSFSSFAWLQRIIRRNFSFGEFLNCWP